VETTLLRALVLPENNPDRILAASRLAEHPEWYEGLPSAALLEALSLAPCPSNPLDVAPDNSSRIMLALALDKNRQEADEKALSSRSIQASLVHLVANTLNTLASRYLKRRQRELRVLMAEADRRGDTVMLTQLTREKLEVDRKIHQQ
jgi:DNA primase